MKGTMHRAQRVAQQRAMRAMGRACATTAAAGCWRGEESEEGQGDGNEMEVDEVGGRAMARGAV